SGEAKVTCPDHARMAGVRESIRERGRDARAPEPAQAPDGWPHLLITLGGEPCSPVYCSTIALAPGAGERLPMSTPEPLTQWIDRLKAGDRDAARQLWLCCWQRLLEFARKKLPKVRRVTDEEDVALSAFDSFCRGAEGEKFAELEDSRDLWEILGMLI